MKDFFFSEIINRMIRYNSPDIKRINHAMKVFSFAQAICSGENAEENIQLVAGITGILHDIGIHNAEKKHNSSAWHFQEMEGPDTAKSLMDSLDIENQIKDRCYYIIGNHHSYNKIDGIDFQILAEADSLVNIDEDGVHNTDRRIMAERLFKTDTGKNMLISLFGKFIL